jgi:hypothetical protein
MLIPPLYAEEFGRRVDGTCLLNSTLHILPPAHDVLIFFGLEVTLHESLFCF